jgi:hypothetical protein
VDAIQLTGGTGSFTDALDAITATGVALDAAATEYAQAARTLAGHSLLDAANFYMRHHDNGVAGRMVSDAIEDFRQAKRGAGRSSVYLKEIRYRLGSFARAFNLEVRELVAQEVADYLEGLKLQSRSFNNQLSMLRTFVLPLLSGEGMAFKARRLAFAYRKAVTNRLRYRDIHARGVARSPRCGSPARCDMPRHSSVRRRPHCRTLTA